MHLLRRIPFVASLALGIAALAVVRPARAEFRWLNPVPTNADLGGLAFESATVGYVVGEFAAVLRTTDGGITWEDRSPMDPAAPDLLDVEILAPGVLLAAGDAPGLHRSTDGGFTWSPVANPANAALGSLFRLDAVTLFAGGPAGRLLRSADNGTTWTQLASPGGEVFDQWWKSATTGYVVGPSRVRRTTDGGLTWAAVPGVLDTSSFLSGDVSFVDALTGWILLDFSTYRTTDGGTTWAQAGPSFPLGPIYQNEGVVLDPLTRLVATDGEGAGLWKTTDNGTTWTQTFDHPGSRGITDMQRLSSGALVAVSSNGDLLRSSDSGSTWTNFSEVAGTAERQNLEVVDALPGGLGFAGGWGGIWVRTTDGGLTWDDPPARPALANVFAIEVRDPSFVLAGGSNVGVPSAVLRSTDGGDTWTTHPLAASNIGSPLGFAAFPDGTCWCVTYGGTGLNHVFRSTDHGQTWQQRDTGLATPRLQDLFFLDPDHGFVCGGEFSTATLSRTTDGGASWTPAALSGVAIGLIQDMHWFDANTGLICGDGRIQRSTDGGATWSTVSTGSGAYAMDFVDATTGYVDALFNGMRRTTDGGLTWTLLPVPTSGYFDDLLARADGFLTVGLSNGILGYFDAPVTAAPVVAAAAAPTDRPVCWPNPMSLAAGRALQVQWTGQPAQRVDARVVDVRGRVLQSGPLILDAAGRGTVALDPARLGAGVVFLELRTYDGARAARKLTLVE